VKNQMIRKGGALVLGAGLVLLTGGCPLLKVEAEVPEACVTYRDLQIPGSDGTGAISHSFVLDSVDAAHVTVAAPGRPDASIVDCAGDCPAGQSELVLDTASVVDALDYLDAESLTVTIDVAGELPTSAWTMDVDVCVKAKVAYTVEV
jgi:hypothetical protein